MPFLIHSAFPFMVPILSCFYNMISVRYKNNPFFTLTSGLWWASYYLSDMQSSGVYIFRDSGVRCTYLSMTICCLPINAGTTQMTWHVYWHTQPRVHIPPFSDSWALTVTVSLTPTVCVLKHSHLQLPWRSPVNIWSCVTLTRVC